MAELTVIADYKDRCGGGPIWDARHNRLYLTALASDSIAMTGPLRNMRSSGRV